MATWAQMIPGIRTGLPAAIQPLALLSLALLTLAGVPRAMAGASGTQADTPVAPGTATAAGCLESGDGYLRAHVAGAIEAHIDWPNSGTRCEGESKSQAAGIRLSFQRAAGGQPPLLFVFGITGVHKGQPAHAIGVNLTVIEQGTPHIFGTLGDTRCTADSLSQTALQPAGTYRVEVRGFCTQPAHAVHGEGDILVSTFEFAGKVTYEAADP